MKHFHPKLIGTAALAALALTSAVGCKNPSSAVGNPFLAPGRVPPPATRALLPGEAQPYYPGDPLPVMQSQAPVPAGAQIVAAEPAMPSATEILKWSSPKAGPQAIASAPPAAPVSPTASAPQAIAATATPPVTAAAEPSIAVPDDGDALRFAMGAPAEPQPLTPPAAAPIVVQPAPSRVVATSPPQTVVPASYTEPTLAIAEPAASPWRTPQSTAPQSSSAALMLPLPPAPTSVAAAPALWPMTAPPLFAATNSMDVRLRAVPSPPGDYYSPTPRIRMPGYEPTPYVGTSDGFRPRTSMR